MDFLSVPETEIDLRKLGTDMELIDLLTINISLKGSKSRKIQHSVAKQKET